MLSNTHLDQLFSATNIDVTRLEFIQKSQNYVYRYSDGDDQKIIRICKGRYRTVSQVEAELIWVNHLADCGIKTCRPIELQDGTFLKSVEINGEDNILTLFKHAPGSQVDRSKADEAFFERIGRLTGEMHTAAHHFSQANESIERPLWKDSRLLNHDVETHKNLIKSSTLKSLNQLIKSISNTSQSDENFGIIHADINSVNLHQNNNDLWIYDFDNCEYGYFTQDLATILWDSIYCKVLNKFADNGMNARIQPFWEALLKGYSSASPMKMLDLTLLKKLFLLREATIYIHYHRTLNLAEISESLGQGLEVMRNNIEAQDHQVDFKFISEQQTYMTLSHEH